MKVTLEFDIGAQDAQNKSKALEGVANNPLELLERRVAAQYASDLMGEMAEILKEEVTT